MTKPYGGNLPFSANEDTVRALFAAYGRNGLNGKDFGGRPLRVNEAQDRGGGSTHSRRR